MSDISDGNFDEKKKYLLNSIQDATFIAVDFEFMGIDNNSSTLFDTPSDRYRQLRKSVMSYHPSQVGISVFKQRKSGKYRSTFYSIHLLQRMGNDKTHLSVDSMRFLMDNGFDISKVFSDGVEYNRKSSYDEFKKDMYKLEPLNIPKPVKSRIAKLKICLSEIIENAKCSNLVNVSDIEVEDCNDKVLPSAETFKIQLQERLPSLSNVERHLIVLQMTKSFKRIFFSFDADNSTLLAKNLPNVDWSQNLKSQHKKCCEAYLGISSIFHEVSTKKTPIVGHNCLADCMYIYHYFFEPLPEDYEIFKTKFHNFFPLVVDSKLIAQQLMPTLTEKGVISSSLQALGDFFITETALSMVPPEIRRFLPWKNETGIADDIEEKFYHDAGFDAFVTGEIFLKMCHILINSGNGKSNEVVLFRRMMQYINNFANRIPFTLLDADCCNLNGLDEAGSRPDLIIVIKKDQKIIEDNEFQAEKSSLKKDMEYYKFEIRRSKCRKYMEIATNSRNTFAQVNEKYTRHKIYALKDEFDSGKRLSYEERLASSRSKKDGMTSGAVFHKELSSKRAEQLNSLLK